MTDVSIIFINYNTVNFLVDAIDSVLYHTTDIGYEIIVVDNHSSDNSQAILDERYGKKALYLSLKENIGFGRANNEGIKIARGRNIFLLNPDTVLQNNAVKILSDYLDTQIEVGVCGGNLFDGNGNPAYSFTREFPSLYGGIMAFVSGLYANISGQIREFNYGSRPIKVACITGADMMIRKIVLEKTGVFDADFFMYAEEVELSVRIRRKGYKIVNVPQARITHLEGKSIELNEKRIRLQLEGRKLFFRKTYSSFYGKLVKSEYYILALLRMCIFRLTRNKQKSDEWQLKSRLMKEIWF